MACCRHCRRPGLAANNESLVGLPAATSPAAVSCVLCVAAKHPLGCVDLCHSHGSPRTGCRASTCLHILNYSFFKHSFLCHPSSTFSSADNLPPRSSTSLHLWSPSWIINSFNFFAIPSPLFPGPTLLHLVLSPPPLPPLLPPPMSQETGGRGGKKEEEEERGRGFLHA